MCFGAGHIEQCRPAPCITRRPVPLKELNGSRVAGRVHAFVRQLRPMCPDIRLVCQFSPPG
jgi:hypothetical protein